VSRDETLVVRQLGRVIEHDARLGYCITPALRANRRATIISGHTAPLEASVRTRVVLDQPDRDRDRALPHMGRVARPKRGGDGAQARDD
jgi:hypothetical protein